MIYKTVKTIAYSDQKPGTSGLRKKVVVFQQDNYLANFIQSIFNALVKSYNEPVEPFGTLILGGDGRFYNAEAMQIILKMAAANGWSRVIVARGGHLSTPAASHLIRLYKARGGIILSASHNPAGPDADFGVKYNIESGSAAPQSLTDKIYELSQTITKYSIVESQPISLAMIGIFKLGDMTIEVIDPVQHYATLMAEIFDFKLIAKAIASGLKFSFNAMHAITGEYAIEIFHKRLGVPLQNIKNAQVLEDFGQGHPDPTPENLGDFFNDFIGPNAKYDIGGACDGDGDRNLIVGRNQYISPSDSLAVLLSYAHLLKYYENRIYGVARSMPTSRAVDAVANRMNIALYETPTGWKFFGNLLDTKEITFCGEESFGAGSLHIREKDGIWAILFWLSILATTKKSVKELMIEHWQSYGRHYYARYDYLDLACEKADIFMTMLQKKLPFLVGSTIDGYMIEKAEDFSYYDSLDRTTSEHQGIKLTLRTGQRIIYRLSGTGTSGAILRLYIEHYEKDPRHHSLDTQEVLRSFLNLAQNIAQIKAILGKSAPDLMV